jgi:uncharacterized membrane protein
MGRMVAPWNLFPNGKDANLCKNFWVICMLSLNFQLVLGQVFLWTALTITAPRSANLGGVVLTLIVYFGLACVVASRFILPVTYKLKLCT